MLHGRQIQETDIYSFLQIDFALKLEYGVGKVHDSHEQANKASTEPSEL